MNDLLHDAALTMSETSTIANSPSTESRTQPESEHIVFFDGVCGLCNHTVDFLLRSDVAGLMKFAPLQGSTAANLLPEDVRVRLDTMAYYRGGQVYYRSAAVVRFLRDLHGFWGIAGLLLWVIPGPLRDVAYRCVSAMRYRLFGKHEACRIPTPAERSRFLD